LSSCAAGKKKKEKEGTLLSADLRSEEKKNQEGAISKKIKKRFYPESPGEKKKASSSIANKGKRTPEEVIRCNAPQTKGIKEGERGPAPISLGEGSKQSGRARATRKPQPGQAEKKEREPEAVEGGGVFPATNFYARTT